AAGGERIVYRDQRARAVADIGEIARALCVSGDAIRVRLALAEFEAFVAEEEKSLVLPHRASDVPAVLILCESRARNAGLVVEERVAIEHLIAQELVQAAVEIIGA